MSLYYYVGDVQTTTLQVGVILSSFSIQLDQKVDMHILKAGGLFNNQIEVIHDRLSDKYDENS